MSKTRSSDVVMGFAIGSVIGAVAALMLAPAPGSETRRRLREIGVRTADRARGAIEGARRVAGDRAHRLGLAFEEGRAAYVRHAGNAESGWSAAGATEVKPDEPGAA